MGLEFFAINKYIGIGCFALSGASRRPTARQPKGLIGIEQALSDRTLARSTRADEHDDEWFSGH